MITTAPSFGTDSTTPAGPYGAGINGIGGGGFDARDSQSKLRDILRDQSRREEVQQHHHISPSSTLQQLATSLQRQGSASRYSARPPSATTPSSLSGGFSSSPPPATAMGGASSSVASTPAEERVSPPLQGAQVAAHHLQSGSMGGQLASSSSYSGNMQQERSTRPMYAEHQLGIPPEITLASSNLSRSQSSAGMSNGIDLKVVILGAQGVGKTSLVHRYTSGQFSASSVPSTIGASFLTKKLIVDGVKVRLQLWDTAGQERFRSMAPMYYRGSNAAVIVYDITNPSSFEDVRTWIEELRKNVRSDLVIHIVGSKVDLAAHSRKVFLEDAREKIMEWTAPPLPPTSPPSIRSRSAFGAIGRMNTLSNVSASALPTLPSSPSSTSRLAAGFGGLTGLGSRNSRTTQQTKDGDDEPADGDFHSSPSTASSSGGGGAADSSRAEEWDFIEVSEVSSKDNEGIEDVFAGIATRLVERKEDMEALARSRRDRASIFVDEASAMDNLHAANRASGGWCCAG